MAQIDSRSPAGSPTNSRNVAIAFSANEGNVTFYCSLDGAVAAACTSPFSASSLADGSHIFQVFAKDSAGNQSNSAISTWLVDASVPTVSIVSRTPANSPSSSRNLIVAFNGNEPNLTFYCALDAQVAATCASPFSTTNLIEGAHAFSVYAKDSAGNQSATAITQWIIDTTAPSVTSLSRTPSLNPTNTTSATFTFASNESGVVFTCALDGAASSVCTSPYALSGLSNGNHTFTVSARDAAQNLGAPTSLNWTIDLLAPVASITSRLPASSPTNSRSFTVNFAANEADVTYLCSLDSAPNSACTSPFSASNLADGTHIFQVVAKDASGNTGNPATTSWIIDATAPITQLTSRTPSGGLVNGKNTSILFNANEAGSTFTCTLDNVTTACSSPFTASNLAEGNHSFTVTATDAVGNVGNSVSTVWTIDAIAPITTLYERTPAGSPTNSKSVTFTFSANDSGATLFCSLDSSNATQCASPFAAVNLAEGNHTFQVFARDAANNQGNIVVSQWTIDVTAPITAIVSRDPAGSPTSQKAASFTFTSNETASTYFCALDGASPTSCTSPFIAANLSDGAHTFRVYSKDASGNQGTTVSDGWVVDATAPVIAWDSISPITSPTSQTSASFAFSANEAGVVFHCSLDGVTPSPCTSPVSLTGLADGSHSYVVFAKDNAGNQSVSVNANWVVDSAAPAIFLGTATPSYSPSIATSKSISFSASEPASFTCALNGGTPTFCNSPYTASSLSDGDYQLSIFARDAAGNTSTGMVVAWQVNTAPLSTTNVSITTITNHSALISWTTSVPSNGRVIYGVGSNLNQTTELNPTNVKNHAISLTGLAKFTLYSVQTISTDPDGRETRSSIRTFRTQN